MIRKIALLWLCVTLSLNCFAQESFKSEFRARYSVYSLVDQEGVPVLDITNLDIGKSRVIYYSHKTALQDSAVYVTLKAGKMDSEGGIVLLKYPKGSMEKIIIDKSGDSCIVHNTVANKRFKYR